MCDSIPSRFSAQCRSYVRQYGDMIVDMMSQELTPEMVCSALGYCVKARSVSPARPRSDNNCALCEFAMATLERILGDKKNEEEVREALDQLCGYMPKSVSQQCVEYVDAYAEQVRMELEDGVEKVQNLSQMSMEAYSREKTTAALPCNQAIVPVPFYLLKCARLRFRGHTWNLSKALPRLCEIR